MTISITKELAAAIAGNKGDRRRAALRDMVSQMMKNKPADWGGKAIKAMAANQLVVNGQANPRPTETGFRDQMTQVTLFAIISGMQSLDDAIAAVAANMNHAHWGFLWSRAEVATRVAGLIQAIADADGNEMANRAESLGQEIGEPILFDGKHDLDAEFLAFIKAHADGVLDDTIESLAELAKQESSAKASLVLPELTGPQVSTANAVFGALGLPTYDDMRKAIVSMNAENESLRAGPKGMNISLNFNGQPNLAASGTVPAGKMEMRKAKDLFNVGAAAKQFDFDVPFFVWDAPHRDVPEIDPHYQFEPVSLMRALWAIVVGKNVWAFGDTGSGKSTLFEQICARLQFPMVRVNFDSEITRMELLGKDTIITDSSGNTVTKFLDGVLPDAVGRPCLLLCDEVDAVRPDAAFILQRMLESKGLLIAEDGGRFIQPDPMFRIAATGNTKGSGDDSGRYMGARVQNGAFLDRFTVWINVDYMKPAQLERLVIDKVPGAKAIATKLAQYAKEHWIGFRQGDIQLPLSPRGVIAAAEAYTFYSGLMTEKDALNFAIRTTISDRSTDADSQTINGLVQRVFK